MLCTYTGMGLHCHYKLSWCVQICLCNFTEIWLPLTCSIKLCSCVITRKLCGCDDTHQDIFFFWGCGVGVLSIKLDCCHWACLWVHHGISSKNPVYHPIIPFSRFNPISVLVRPFHQRMLHSSTVSRDIKSALTDLWYLILSLRGILRNSDRHFLLNHKIYQSCLSAYLTFASKSCRPLLWYPYTFNLEVHCLWNMTVYISWPIGIAQYDAIGWVILGETLSQIWRRTRTRRTRKPNSEN